MVLFTKSHNHHHIHSDQEQYQPIFYLFILSHLLLLTNLAAPISFQDCSTMSDPTTHQPPIQSPEPISPPQSYLPRSLLFESPISYSPTSSNTIYFNNNYSPATSQGIQQLIYMDTQKTNTTP